MIMKLLKQIAFHLSLGIEWVGFILGIIPAILVDLGEYLIELLGFNEDGE